MIEKGTQVKQKSTNEIFEIITLINKDYNVFSDFDHSWYTLQRVRDGKIGTASKEELLEYFEIIS